MGEAEIMKKENNPTAIKNTTPSLKRFNLKNNVQNLFKSQIVIVKREQVIEIDPKLIVLTSRPAIANTLVGSILNSKRKVCILLRGYFPIFSR